MIAFCIPVYGRQRTVEACGPFLEAAAHRSRFPVAYYFGGDDPWLEPYCRRHGFSYVEATNDQKLGSKWNQIIKAALTDCNPTHIGILGSDTIFEPGIFDHYPQDVDIFGWDDCYFLDPPTLHYWPGYTHRDETIGVGRCYSRRIIDLLDGELYSPTPSGCDGSATSRTSRKSLRDRYKAMGSRVSQFLEPGAPTIQRKRLMQTGAVMISLKEAGLNPMSAIGGCADVLDGPALDLARKWLEIWAAAQ